MSRLNTVMKLVTNPEYTSVFQSLRIPDPYSVVAVNSSNELILVIYDHSSTDSRRCAVPKKKVVQIVAGFSEIA